MPAAPASRLQAAQLARQFAAKQPLYLDTETTGLDPSSEIVEVALLDHDGAVLMETLVRPTRRIPPDAMWVHGITNEMVAEAPPWPEVWAELAALLQGRALGIYNAEIDLRLMRQSHKAHGLAWQSPAFFPFCIMNLYAQFRGERGRTRGTYRWQSLENARRQCGLLLPNEHRALADTALAREVFLHMAAWASA